MENNCRFKVGDSVRINNSMISEHEGSHIVSGVSIQGNSVHYRLTGLFGWFLQNDLELIKSHIERYILVESSSTLAFQKSVNEKINEGYLPQGGVCYTDGFYTQAMFYGCQ